MNREAQLQVISQALDVIQRQPVPNQCKPVANGQLGMHWLWHTPERTTVIVRVHYAESQREQDGHVVGLRVPLSAIAVQQQGEWAPLAEFTEDAKTHLLSFSRSRPYHLSAIAGLMEAFNDALETVEVQV